MLILYKTNISKTKRKVYEKLERNKMGGGTRKQVLNLKKDMVVKDVLKIRETKAVWRSIFL